MPPFPSRQSLLPLLLLGLTLLIPCDSARGQDAEPGTTPKSSFPDPQTEAGQIRVPAGFKAEVFAAEPQVQNPSAFHIDERGRFFVVEANRRKNGVLDMRQLAPWVEEDLASRSVQDRIKMVERHYGPKEMAAMREKTDRIRLIEDRDGDGRADFDTIFADGFNRLESGTAAGVLAWRGNVYFTEIPDLWLLRDTAGAGHADQRTSLAWGFGVRYNISGHDMHGLRVGPDGRIYWSIGDRGARVEKDGRIVIDNPDSGAVFRCEPDGSHIELFATGLRNPEDLAFDAFGNLFTGDNNSDAGDTSRWVYVVEGGDNGWRTPYQHHDFPVGHGVWMTEKPWLVDPPVPANYRLPPVANIKVSGPAGLTYNPGTGMPKSFDDAFFLVDFRGGASNSGIFTLKNKPRGASFELVEEKEVVGNILPTDVEFGYTGGFYFTSWVAGWEPLKQGRIYHVFDPAAAKDPLVAETRKLMAERMDGRNPEELTRLLGHPDQRVRQAAQFALAAKGDVGALVTVAERNESRVARLHAIWGLGQIARRSKDPASVLAPVVRLTADPDEEVRSQAANVLGDCRDPRAADELIKLLSDRKLRPRFFAAMALAKMGNPDAVGPILAMLRKNADRDAILRHAGVMALSKLAEPARLLSEADKDPAVRMSVLLALRRLGRPEVAHFLSDGQPELMLEAARAINDLPISEALPRLAAVAAPPVASTADQPATTQPTVLPEPIRTAVLLRAINANYRLGTAQAASLLAAFAGRGDVPESLRAEALHMLATWDQPPARDRVSALYRPLAARDPAIARAALAPALDRLLETAPDPVKIAALHAATATGLQTKPLETIVADRKVSAGVRAAALGVMAGRKDQKTADAVKLALADPDETLRTAAIRLQPKQPGGLAPLKEFLERGTPREQQAVLQALAAVGAKDKAAEAMIAAAFERLSNGRLAPEAVLDLLEAAEAHKRGKVAEQLKAYESSRAATAVKDPLASYRECLAGGDPRAGESIFRDRQDVSCIRCHSIRAQGGNAGPDLAGVSKRAPGSEYHSGREYILESILHPAKKIAPGFETVTIRTTDDEDVIAGVLKAEDDAQVTLDVPNQGLVKVQKSRIRSRKGGMSAMPDDIAKTLSKRDLRDLVEFLAAQ